MSTFLAELTASAPLAIILLTGLVVITVDALAKDTRQLTCWISGGGLLVAMAIAIWTIGETATVYHGMLNTGGYAGYWTVVFCLSGFLSVLLSAEYLVKEGIEHGEYYGLMLFAISGMVAMAGAADLVVFFLGLEIMSVSFYVLAGFHRSRTKSNEAALKYFLLGAFATGFLLYGIALIYGTTGTTSVAPILGRVGTHAGNPMFLVGLALLLIGVSFKVAVVPFHMWVPDVYDGSPTTVTGFMSTGGKAAAFSFLLLFFGPAVMHGVQPLREILAILAALSMVVGNVIAVSQSSVKRMLAYSSIAHAGYILTGVVAGNAFGQNGVLFYLLAYTVMNVGAFGVLSILESPDGGGLLFDDYAGLSKRKPFLAALMALFMFSLSGIPPFAGFFGKYYVFAGAIQAGYTWLAIVGVLMSAISVYYYLRLVVMMYFRDDQGEDVQVSRLGFAALVIAAIAILELGIFPSTIVNLTSRFF